MRTSSELLLTFLLNALWQIPVIAVAASLGAWALKRSSARYRHRLWVGALLLSLLIPFLATARLSLEKRSRAAASTLQVAESGSQAVSPSTPISTTSSTSSQTTSPILLNTTLAIVIIGIYGAILLFGSFRLSKAWFATRRIKRSANRVVMNEALRDVLAKCQSSISSRNVQILSSQYVPVPVTLGVVSPVIILPETLVREGNLDLLTSAIAHEFIHVTRRDYVLNLAYEVVYLLLSFNPASALIRRRIKQTRELSCDELVAERVLEPDVYARSLVTLASAAPTVNRLSVTATVGIADADILEVRIMSLMNKSKLYPRSRRLLLIGVALMLLVASVTAMSLAMRFDVDPFTSALAQEQESKEKEKVKEKERSPEFEAGVRAAQKELQRKKAVGGEFEARDWRLEEEIKARSVMHAELVRLARIPMDQAILIATSQYPGKVLQSSLGATRWEKLGELAKDGHVFYHVTVLGDDNSTLTHVWVNAIDGTIIKSEKELPRKARQSEP